MAEDEGRSLPVVGDVGTVERGDAAERCSPEPQRGERGITPLQAELLDSGALPDPDELGRAMLGPALAPKAGYGEAGPPPLDGPGGAPSPKRAPPADGEGTEEGRAEVGIPVPVHQWEVDPRNETLPVEEVQAERDGWEYRMWWQEHPSGLVYASLQALRSGPEEAAAPARAHPVGRAVAVNLVYDARREAVVAVYGTARDFRPFVAAFWEAYRDVEGSERGTPSTGADAGGEDREDHPSETGAG